MRRKKEEEWLFQCFPFPRCKKFNRDHMQRLEERDERDERERNERETRERREREIQSSEGECQPGF